MMASFGRSMEREELTKSLEKSKEEIEKKFKDKNTTYDEIKKHC
jgi:hypothetical protein